MLDGMIQKRRRKQADRQTAIIAEPTDIITELPQERDIILTLTAEVKTAIEQAIFQD